MLTAITGLGMNDHTTPTGLPPPGAIARGQARTDQQDRLSAPRRDQRAGSRAAQAKWVLLLIVLTAIAGATFYWYVTKDEASTDDAYTDGHAVTMSPQVSGTVVALHVTDNQRVKAGDVLIEIDPRAYNAARDQAQGSLQVADAQLANARIGLERARVDYPARLASAQAQLAAAQATQFKTDADARRQRSLPKAATTQQDIDNASAALPLGGCAGGSGAGRGAAGRPGAAVHRRGRGAGATARGAGGARPGPAGPGEAEPVMDPGHRAAGRLDHQAQRRAGQLRAGRTVDLLDRHAGGLDHRQLQGIAARPHASRASRWISASTPTRT